MQSLRIAPPARFTNAASAGSWEVDDRTSPGNSLVTWRWNDERRDPRRPRPRCCPAWTRPGQASRAPSDVSSPRSSREVRDPAGWAVKDHLMHVAAWEDAFVARLEGRPTHEALGLDGGDARPGRGRRQCRRSSRATGDRPLTEVLDALRRATARRGRVLAALHDRTVAGPVSGVLPPGSADSGFTIDTNRGVTPRRREPGSAGTRGSTTTRITAGSGSWSRAD